MVLGRDPEGFHGRGWATYIRRALDSVHTEAERVERDKSSGSGRATVRLKELSPQESP